MLRPKSLLVHSLPGVSAVPPIRRGDVGPHSSLCSRTFRVAMIAVHHLSVSCLEAHTPRTRNTVKWKWSLSQNGDRLIAGNINNIYIYICTLDPWCINVFGIFLAWLRHKVLYGPRLNARSPCNKICPWLTLPNYHKPSFTSLGKTHSGLQPEYQRWKTRAGNREGV